eukprot:Gb_23258 [translate_table: standard]
MASVLRTAAIVLSSHHTLFSSSPFTTSFCSYSRSFCISIPSSYSASFIHHKPLCSSTSPISARLNAEDDPSSASSPLPEDASSNAEASLRAAVEALDIRVGRILKAWKHPEADSLYVEEVDVGEPDPRTICSGLVKYIPEDELQGRNVVVLANLKPRNMRGVKSNGMLMAASDAAHEHVELLTPPEGSIPGERIWFGSDKEAINQSDAASPNQVQKKKIWEIVQPYLKTTDDCVAVFGKSTMRTSVGLVTCKSLKSANIS